MSEDVVVVASGLHGDRTFRRVRWEPYQRRDGTETVLAVWEGTCVICGVSFEFRTPTGVTEPEHSKSFGVTTCKVHRLTSAEAASLRFAKPAERRGRFEAIKDRKLAGR